MQARVKETVICRAVVGVLTRRGAGEHLSDMGGIGGGSRPGSGKGRGAAVELRAEDGTWRSSARMCLNGGKGHDCFPVGGKGRRLGRCDAMRGLVRSGAVRLRNVVS